MTRWIETLSWFSALWRISKHKKTFHPEIYHFPHLLCIYDRFSFSSVFENTKIQTWKYWNNIKQTEETNTIILYNTSIFPIDLKNLSEKLREKSFLIERVIFLYTLEPKIHQIYIYCLSVFPTTDVKRHPYIWNMNVRKTNKLKWIQMKLSIIPFLHPMAFKSCIDEIYILFEKLHLYIFSMTCKPALT